jgi:hypothetical protein
MQKINFDELRTGPDRPAWGELIFVRAVMATTNLDPTPGKPYDLEFTINGKEVDFKKFCEMFGKNWDEQVRRDAVELIMSSARLEKFRQTMDNMDAVLTEKLKEEVCQLLGMPRDELSRYVD